MMNNILNKVKATSLALSLSIFALTALPTSTTFAQQAKGKVKVSSSARVNQKTAKMTKSLGLSTEQEVKVKAINKKYASKLDKIRAAEYNSKQEKRAEVKPVLEARDKELKKVLNKGQYQKYQVQKNNKKAKHKHAHQKGKHTKGKGHNHHHADPVQRAKKRTERMKTALNLSAKQANAVESLNMRFAKKKVAVKGNDNISLEDRKQKMTDIRVEYDAELERILTKEQYVKYISLKAKKKGKRNHPNNRPQPERRGLDK